MSHKFQIYGGENEEVERFEQITRALRARYEPGCCGGTEPVQLARRGQGRESRSSAYADRRQGQRVIAKRCGRTTTWSAHRGNRNGRGGRRRWAPMSIVRSSAGGPSGCASPTACR